MTLLPEVRRQAGVKAALAGLRGSLFAIHAQEISTIPDDGEVGADDIRRRALPVAVDVKGLQDGKVDPLGVHKRLRSAAGGSQDVD